MKIHVTGVAGLIGSHLARYWLDQGAFVSASDDLSGGYGDNIDLRCDFIKVDCRNFEAMKVILRGIDVVYHCAAAPHEGLSVFSPVTITDSVFGSTMSVLTAAIVNKVKRFVGFSSMARYGPIPVPYTEDQVPHPEDPYGIAKLASEHEIALLSKIHGMEYTIAVPHNVGGSGQVYTDPFRNVIGIMINRCLQGKPPIIYGDGMQRRCFSHISDALDSLVKMATQANGEIVNIGPDEEFVTINHLAYLIIKHTGFRGEPLYVPPRPQEVQHAYCSADKARKLLGYQTKVTLEEMIIEMVEWVRKRGPRPFNYHLPLEIISEKTPKTWVDRMF